MIFYIHSCWSWDVGRPRIIHMICSIQVRVFPADGDFKTGISTIYITLVLPSYLQVQLPRDVFSIFITHSVLILILLFISITSVQYPAKRSSCTFWSRFPQPQCIARTCAFSRPLIHPIRQYPSLATISLTWRRSQKIQIYVENLISIRWRIDSGSRNPQGPQPH